MSEPNFNNHSEGKDETKLKEEMEMRKRGKSVAEEERNGQRAV